MDKAVNLNDKMLEYKGYWKIIVLFTVISMSLSLLSSIFAPKIYQCEAVVAIPDFPGQIVNRDIKGNVLALANVSETRAMTKSIISLSKVNGIDKQTADTLLFKISRIIINEIRGSNTKFKIILQSNNKPETLPLILEQLILKINSNSYIIKRLDGEKIYFQESLALINEALVKAKGERTISINTIVNLQEKKIKLERNISSIHGYEFVVPPMANSSSVNRNPMTSLLLFGFLGIMLGILTSMMVHFIRINK
jgi:uncharacterized protein involved in exopolysaccharide biosynthesis